MWKIKDSEGSEGSKRQRSCYELIWFFLRAVKNGNLDDCKEIVQDCREENGEREKLLNHVTYCNRTLLHMAALFEGAPIIDWLLSDAEGGGRSLGFNSVLAVTEDGDNALHLAAAKQWSVETCKAIIDGCRVDNGERREMINARNSNGWTVLHIAADRHDAELIEWILSEDGGRGAGFDLVSARTADTLLSALDYAVQYHNSDLVTALLSHCSSAERMNLFLAVDSENGWTSLRRSVIHEPSSIISALHLYPECGLLFNSKDNRGMTILHRAIIQGLDDNSDREWFESDPHSRERIVTALLGLNDEQFSSSSSSSTTITTTTSSPWIDPNIGLGL